MKKPNFIVFITDDQGYGDLSCMGTTDFQTPNIDRLAIGGARSTDFYANCPVCSPSRASLLTGRYPARAGVRSIIAGHRTASGLPQDISALPKALKKEDYNTYMSGKWHLGLAETSRPHSHGFDKWYGFLAGCIDYYSHIFYWGMNKGGLGNNPTHDLWEDNKECWDNGKYYTEAITEKAVEYIHDSTKSDEPFFLYVAYNAPHYPMHAPQKYIDRFPNLPKDRQIMAAMISAVDDGVGEIMNELERLGLRDNTCTFYMSDNGPSRESRNWLDGNPDLYYGGSAGVLKGHKFSLYEGGIRVPGIINWPGTIPAGQVLHEPMAAMDIMPTFIKAAGGNPEQYGVDGCDILPYIVTGKTLPQRDLFWEMDSQTAIRRGKWKLVLEGRLDESKESTSAVHLADLEKDMGEQINLENQFPEIVKELKTAAESWRSGIEQEWNERQKGMDSGIVTYTNLKV